MNRVTIIERTSYNYSPSARDTLRTAADAVHALNSCNLVCAIHDMHAQQRCKNEMHLHIFSGVILCNFARALLTCMWDVHLPEWSMLQPQLSNAAWYHYIVRQCMHAAVNGLQTCS